jgi:hypothetical protein
MANQYDTNLKLQAIADAIGDTSSSGLISALEDIADAVAGGGGGSSAGLVSDNFSETDTYDLGDYCIHNNTMYVCINAITTPGPWDLSDWQATNAGLELNSLNSALTPQSFAFSASSGVNINAGDSAVYKVGRQIHFNILATLTSAWTTKYMVVGVLPVGCRPIVSSWLGVGSNNAIDKPCACIIGANGEVKLYRDDTASTTSIRAGGTFICAV